MPLRLRGARFIRVRRWAAAKTAALRRSSNVWPKYGGSGDGADPIHSPVPHLGPRARGGRVPPGSLGAAINRSKLAQQRRSRASSSACCPLSQSLRARDSGTLHRHAASTRLRRGGGRLRRGLHARYDEGIVCRRAGTAGGRSVVRIDRGISRISAIRKPQHLIRTAMRGASRRITRHADYPHLRRRSCRPCRTGWTCWPRRALFTLRPGRSLRKGVTCGQDRHESGARQRAKNSDSAGPFTVVHAQPSNIAAKLCHRRPGVAPQQRTPVLTSCVQGGARGVGQGGTSERFVLILPAIVEANCPPQQDYNS
jgi:hypothetical protein